MVVVFFTFDPRVRSKKVKKGQILKIWFLNFKHMFLMLLCLRIPMMSFIFESDKGKGPKNAIEKSDVIY